MNRLLTTGATCALFLVGCGTKADAPPAAMTDAKATFTLGKTV